MEHNTGDVCRVGCDYIIKSNNYLILCNYLERELTDANEHIKQLKSDLLKLQDRQDIHDNLIKSIQQEGRSGQDLGDIVNKHFWDLT